MKAATFVVVFLALSGAAAGQPAAGVASPSAGSGSRPCLHGSRPCLLESGPCLLESGPCLAEAWPSVPGCDGRAPAWPATAAAAAQHSFWRRPGWEREPRHRIEARFGVWRRPRFSYKESRLDFDTSSADFAFGVEYLRLVAFDVAIGVGTQTRVRATERRFGSSDSFTEGGTSIAVPFVARWNPVRRLTRWRTIEPYVSGGVGPVIRADWETREIDHDRESTADIETAFGARAGAGFDAHIGSVWTVGLVAAWNWVEKPGAVRGYGRHDRGGEVSVTMGWVFGR